ncbi:hypothetical protein [Marinobacter sp. BGYM27]|uniref:hypothetical protein n=1 Tax=Marinobacter sp. BGYM27 TaxID=2975597 RepID=UPI0021A3526C|nr:hypothetical protein [Marinobacter sp. BGYM27]MDG5499645.1 hypothetical protein [Marinobacter sp. BGYM27]
MVRSAVDWPWSSYRATVGYQQDLNALNRDWVLAAFGERRDAAINGYERFVAEGKNQPSQWAHLKNQVYLGSDQFVDDMQRRIEGADQLSDLRQKLVRVTPLFSVSRPKPQMGLWTSYWVI